jgi:ABC-2 type transport system permease protein
MALLSGSYQLMLRGVRASIRQPGVEVGNIFIPLFFFFVSIGSLSAIAGSAFGVDDYKGFLVPVAIVQAVAGAASVSGILVVTDIERGYFDKLLLTPTPRLALVAGQLLCDSIRAGFFTAIVLVVGAIAGAGMDAGAAGYAACLLLAMLFGFAYSGIGLGIGLRTGNAQAAQAGFLLFFPLLFLSPAFAPKQIFEGWLEFLATMNPVTYILEGMRTLILEGWQWDNVLGALAAVAGMGVVTISFALWGLRSRTA